MIYAPDAIKNESLEFSWYPSLEHREHGPKVSLGKSLSDENRIPIYFEQLLAMLNVVASLLRIQEPSEEGEQSPKEDPED